MSLVSQILSSTLSLWRGTRVDAGAQDKPEQALQLYDIEGSGACRLVREALTELDLDVIIYPCPKGGQRFRSRVMALGGIESFPYLVDPNTGRSLDDWRSILRYLFEQYGTGKLPITWRSMGLNGVTATLAGVPRFGAGTFAKPSRRPGLLLELYSFESCPYARPVRERLCELELPYVLRNLGKVVHWQNYLLPPIHKQLGDDYFPTTRNRKELKERAGRVASPYFIDPNKRVSLFESRDIIAYLNQRYGV